MILNPKQQRIGFTSDLHAYHNNIIKYSHRPFKSADEMNEVIRDRHNSMFDKDDIIFNIGDGLLVPKDRATKRIDPIKLAQAEDWIKTFNGRIFYLPGNHEQQINLIRRHWRIMPQYFEIFVKDDDAKHGEQMIALFHYACRTWNKAHHGSWHLYGHSHGGLVDDNGNLMQDSKYSLSMDVGVDTNDYYPYLYEEIKLKMSTKIFRPSDHHSAKMGDFGGEDLSK